MPVTVKWLEDKDVPASFAALGHRRVFRVISYDGSVTDLLSGAAAAALAFKLRDQEDLSLGLLLDHQ